MNKRVIYRSTGFYYLDVEADTVEEAKEIADNTDGIEFTEQEGYGSWNYDSTQDDQGNVLDRERYCIRQSAIAESRFCPISAGLPPVGVPLIVTVRDNLQGKPNELRYPVYYEKDSMKDGYHWSWRYGDYAYELLPEISEVIAWQLFPAPYLEE